MPRCYVCLALILCAAVLVPASFAQQASVTAVPSLIRFGGTLKNAEGASLASATVGVTFAIYSHQDGGAAVWMETQNVTTDAAGNYSILLGSTTANGLPADLFSQQEQRWLGVQAQGQAEQPRVLLVSVPYAIKAHEAETLGGRSVSDFVLATTASAPTSGANAAAAAPILGRSLENSTGTVASFSGPTNFSGSTTDQIVGVTQTGAGAGVNATASNKAVLGTASAQNGFGIEGVSNGTGGIGLYGVAPGHDGIGVKGSSPSTSGTGVRGIATATSGNTTGVSAYVSSSTGTAGVFNNAAGGTILVGQNNGAAKFTVDGSGNVNIAGGFTGDGSALTGIQFSQINGLLGSSQFHGTYSNSVSLTSPSNSFSGNGGGLTGMQFSQFHGQLNNLQLGGTYSNMVNFPNTGNTFTGSSFAGNTFNSATPYQIGGSGVLSIGSVADNNLFVGVGAGTNDMAGSGTGNTFSGYHAGNANTTGVGNIDIGYNSGSNNATDNNNIYIGNTGTSGESSTIRIGGDDGLGYGAQTNTYISGIYGSTSTSGVPVYVNSNGQLGTQTSSSRFKEEVRDMGDSTSALMRLRPVTFIYKPQYDNGSRTLQYGLIAEEVAKVYPELVAYDKDGEPYTVRYQYLNTMLLNEVQKQYHRAESEAQVIHAQEQKIDELEHRLEKLEALANRDRQH
jgi:hypothetical protein